MGQLISVVIPVYNSEKYLKECLKSVVLNTYANLEVILIDDGSSDNSSKICDEISQLDKRIIVIHQNNKGVSYARNRGIDLARGKYIAFIDSDDTVSVDYFEKLLKSLEDRGGDLSICSVSHVQGSETKCDTLRNMVVDFEKIDDDTKRNFLVLNEKYYLYGPVNKLYKTEIIKKNKLGFPADTSYGEDLLFNFRYLEFCKILVYTEEGVYYYNHNNENSLSHKYRENYFENGVRLNKCLEKFCKNNNLFDPTMKKYISNRVFDDAYNSILGYWNEQCCFRMKEKYQNVYRIMNNTELLEAIKFADTQKYTKWICKMIKKRKALLFIIIMQIRKLCIDI